LAVLGLLAGVRFVFLQADFPVHLGGQGMAYTDEGWWSRNAVAWVREGNWYIDDGYNTITNLPVLPLIQVVWFKLFGVGLVSARAISVVCSLLVSGWVYLLARRELSVDFAWIAPLIVLTNYPTFAYSRLALLEMPMLVFLLASLWLATSLKRRALLKIVVSGLLFTLAVLTKTTALFALPVIAIAATLPREIRSPHGWPIDTQSTPANADQNRFGLAQFRLSLIWLLTVGVSLGLCYLALNQFGDVQSQTYFADHNVAAKVPKGLFDFIKGPFRVVKRSFTLFLLLFPGLLCAIALLLRVGKARTSPLFRFVVLWTGAALCAFSLSDFAAPRYFLVLIVPIALAIPLWLESVWNRLWFESSMKLVLFSPFLFYRRVSLIPSLLALTVVVSTGLSLFRIADYLRQPQFTLVETAIAMNNYVEADASSNVVLGSFVDTLSLAADDVKAVNARMGFRSLAHRIETFDPGYYASIGPVGEATRTDDLKIQSVLQETYRLVLLDTFELFQRRDYGQPVFFYRLDSLE